MQLHNTNMETKTIEKSKWAKQVGIIPNDGKDSVEQIREIRKKLSEEKFDLEEMNNFGSL